MDWIMDWIMDSNLDWTANLQTNLAFPGFPAVQYLIASSLVSKVRVLQIPMHFSA